MVHDNMCHASDPVEPQMMKPGEVGPPPGRNSAPPPPALTFRSSASLACMSPSSLALTSSWAWRSLMDLSCTSKAASCSRRFCGVGGGGRPVAVLHLQGGLILTQVLQGAGGGSASGQAPVHVSRYRGRWSLLQHTTADLLAGVRSHSAPAQKDQAHTHTHPWTATNHQTNHLLVFFTWFFSFYFLFIKCFTFTNAAHNRCGP